MAPVGGLLGGRLGRQRFPLRHSPSPRRRLLRSKRTGNLGSAFQAFLQRPAIRHPVDLCPHLLLGSVCPLWTTDPVYTETTTVRHLSTLLLLLLTPDAVAQSGALLRSGFLPLGAQHLDTAGDPSPWLSPFACSSTAYSFREL